VRPPCAPAPLRPAVDTRGPHRPVRMAWARPRRRRRSRHPAPSRPPSLPADCPTTGPPPPAPPAATRTPSGLRAAPRRRRRRRGRWRRRQRPPTQSVGSSKSTTPRPPHARHDGGRLTRWAGCALAAATVAATALGLGRAAAARRSSRRARPVDVTVSRALMRQAVHIWVAAGARAAGVGRRPEGGGRHFPMQSRLKGPPWGQWRCAWETEWSRGLAPSWRAVPRHTRVGLERALRRRRGGGSASWPRGEHHHGVRRGWGRPVQTPPACGAEGFGLAPRRPTPAADEGTRRGGGGGSPRGALCRRRPRF